MRLKEDDPDPHPWAITLYEHLGVIYRRTQTGEVAVEEDICIDSWENRWLEEEIEIPIQWENSRRHYFEREEEEGVAGEKEESRTINLLLLWPEWFPKRFRADDNDEGEDVDGEEGEEEEEEEEYEDTIEEENMESKEEYKEEEDNKENGCIN